MNSNTSTEFPITSVEQRLVPSNLTQQESHQQAVQQSEHTMRPQIQLPTSPIGSNAYNQILLPSEPLSHPKNATSSVSQSSNLKSHVSPQELLEKPPQGPRILRVSKDDINALCQVITEFKEQFIGY
jgi:hypothetical protein